MVRQSVLALFLAGVAISAYAALGSNDLVFSMPAIPEPQDHVMLLAALLLMGVITHRHA